MTRFARTDRSMTESARRGSLVTSAFVVAFLAGCGGDAGEPAAEGGDASEAAIRIAVVPKGTTHEYWRSVQAGALAATRDLNESGVAVEMVFRGPDREDDREQQIALLENLQSGGFDAIVLAPLDQQALVAPVRRIRESGRPVVVIDSGLEGEPGTDYESFIATDNFLAGRLAGEHVAKALDGVGRVLLLRYLEGSESTTQREEGFVAAIAEAGGFELIDPRRFAGATRATAQEASENLLSSVAPRGESDAFDAVFCPNESSTYGMLRALSDRGLAGKVLFVGFDASPDLVTALREGTIDALVVQDPVRMGRLGVETAVKALQGEAVEPRIDTGAVLVVTEEIDEPRHRDLLSPDLDAMLGAGGS